MGLFFLIRVRCALPCQRAFCLSGAFCLVSVQRIPGQRYPSRMARSGPGVDGRALIAPYGRRRVSSRAIRGRSASRCVVSGYRSLPRSRPSASDANRRRAVALRSLFDRVRRPRPVKRRRFCSLIIAAALSHRLASCRPHGWRRRAGGRPGDVMSDLSAVCTAARLAQCRESRASRARRAESTRSLGRPSRPQPPLTPEEHRISTK